MPTGQTLHNQISTTSLVCTAIHDEICPNKQQRNARNSYQSYRLTNAILAFSLK
ncbi:hypothetical protein JCM10512_3965 [Bacteroides reticulotermitis JCM 10512]|uniref:Uncharacterized protein n=1 Tax=Bacteroides reticulotermitis JCM 10512 TaxID=1445607 RepID=W4UXI2_9BACE|nr:hypothetical protein JCM10512_3965 [Bacteroides reticulotermitis JCM 10512]